MIAITRSLVPTLLVALILLVPGGAVPEAQRAWTEVRSPHFTVVTDINDRAARDVAWQLEQMRGVLHAAWPWANVDTDRPLLAIAVRGEDAMKQLVPGMWGNFNEGGPATVFVTGQDRHYVALRADLVQNDRIARVNPYGYAFWSMASVVINTSLGQTMPLWLSRGLATIMGNTLIASDAIQMARMPPDAVEQLSTRSRLHLTELFAVDRASPWMTDNNRLRLFDAEAAAFVHYLMFGDKGAHRDALNGIVNAATDGRAVSTATAALGDPTALEERFMLYLRSQTFAYSRLAIDTTVNRNAFTARALAPAESAAARAALHAALNRPIESRAAIGELRKADASLAAAHDIEGMLLEREGRLDDARAAYGRAIDAGTKNFYVQYRWAALTWPRPDVDEETRGRVAMVLDEATGNNPQYAPAFALLSQVRTRRGQPADGLEPIRRAVALRPDETGYRLMLASTLWNAVRRGEALQEARKALAIASNDRERRDAQQMVNEFESRLTPPSDNGAIPASSAP